MQKKQLENLAIGPDMSTSGNARRAWLSVISVGIGAFAFVTTEFLPVGLLPQIAHDLAVSVGTAGLMVTMPGVVAAISAPAVMLGAKNIDRRSILLLLSSLLLLSNTVSAFAPNFTIMVFGRVLLGAALGGFWGLALALPTRLVQQEHVARAAAIILSGVTLATVFGVPLGTLISDLFSWRFAFVTAAVLAAFALIFQIMLLPALPSRTAVRWCDLWALLGRHNLRKSLMLVMLVFGAHFTSYTYVAPFLLQSGFSPSVITWILLGFGVIGFFSNWWISGVVTDHLKMVLFVMVAILVGALWLLPWLQEFPFGIVGLILAWGVAFGAIPLCLNIWLQFSSPDLPEAGAALFVCVVQVAIALGSFVGGRIVDTVNLSGALWLGAVLGLLGLLVIARFPSVRLAELLRQ